MNPDFAGVERKPEIWVLWWFHRNDNPRMRSTLKVHPRGDPANPLTAHEERTNRQLLSFIEQEIELPPIHGKVGAEIVDVAKRPLHDAHAATGHRAGTVALFKERHGSQMIRVRVGVDHVTIEIRVSLQCLPPKATAKLRLATYDRVFGGVQQSSETVGLPFS
jgi:hypothetical protein